MPFNALQLLVFIGTVPRHMTKIDALRQSSRGQKRLIAHAGRQEGHHAVLASACGQTANSLDAGYRLQAGLTLLGKS